MMSSSADYVAPLKSRNFMLVHLERWAHFCGCACRKQINAKSVLWTALFTAFTVATMTNLCGSQILYCEPPTPPTLSCAQARRACLTFSIKPPQHGYARGSSLQSLRGEHSGNKLSSNMPREGTSRQIHAGKARLSRRIMP